MSGRYDHKQKTETGRRIYRDYIKRQDYSPTVDETLSFPSSEKSEEDFSEPTTKRVRNVSLQDKIKEYVLENYINWIVGGVLVLLVFLMYGSKLDISTLNSSVSNIKENILELKGSTRGNLTKLHDQDLKIQENKLRIEHFREKQVQNNIEQSGKANLQ